jgi:hypothetical protein
MWYEVTAVYHLLEHSKILHFTHIAYLCVADASDNEQQTLPQAA